MHNFMKIIALTITSVENVEICANNLPRIKHHYKPNKTNVILHLSNVKFYTWTQTKSAVAFDFFSIVVVVVFLVGNLNV